MHDAEDKKMKTITECSTQWEPPPLGWLRANVDGSFVADTGVATTDVVIRDHFGKVIVAAGNILPRCGSAEESEALALSDGARLVREWSDHPVIFESDCASVVQDILLGRNSLSHLRSIYSDFASSATLLKNWKCVFARRDQNCATHECAACVRLLGVGSIWTNIVPDRVAKALALDCNRTSVDI
jgi:hypothetical protein